MALHGLYGWHSFLVFALSSYLLTLFVVRAKVGYWNILSAQKNLLCCTWHSEKTTGQPTLLMSSQKVFRFFLALGVFSQNFSLARLFQYRLTFRGRSEAVQLYPIGPLALQDKKTLRVLLAEVSKTTRLIISPPSFSGVNYVSQICTL